MEDLGQGHRQLPGLGQGEVAAVAAVAGQVDAGLPVLVPLLEVGGELGGEDDGLAVRGLAERRRAPAPSGSRPCGFHAGGRLALPVLAGLVWSRQDGVYSPCGIAARQAASKAVTHWTTSSRSRVSS